MLSIWVAVVIVYQADGLITIMLPDVMGDGCLSIGRFQADGNSSNAVNGNKYPGESPQGDLSRFFPFTRIPVQLLVCQYEDNGNRLTAGKTKRNSLCGIME